MKSYLLSFILIFSSFIYSDNLTILKFNDSNAVLDFVKKYLPENPTIVEAGAFDGTDSLRMANFWPKGLLHSFEPVPEIFKWLTNNVKHNKNVKNYNLALSDKTGTAKFFVSRTPDGHLYGSSSLLPAKEHKNHYPFNFDEEITVPTKTLDDWAKSNKIKNIDFLWLDMQGYELPMLKASPNILKTVKVIYTEAIFIEAYKGQHLYKDIKEWLENNGFKAVAQDIDPEKPSHWYCNIIFVKK